MPPLGLAVPAIRRDRSVLEEDGIAPIRQPGAASRARRERGCGGNRSRWSKNISDAVAGWLPERSRLLPPPDLRPARTIAAVNHPPRPCASPSLMQGRRAEGYRVGRPA